MKKLFQIGLVFFGLLMTTNIYSQDYSSYQGDNNCCPQPCAQPCDQPTGECWCRMVDWQPCYYQTRRCVQDVIPCTKTCCRVVPRYFQVQKCRMVPQYYCDTACRYENEFYCVPDCKTCDRWVCDTHCRYVPKYYWKHSCGDANCTTPMPTTSPAPYGQGYGQGYGSQGQCCPTAAPCCQ